MDFKAVKYQILHGSLARRVILRTFMCASVVSIFLALQILSNSDSGMFASVASRDCKEDSAYLDRNPASYLFPDRFLKPVWGSIEYMRCKENANLTLNVVRELMAMQLLDYSAKALCVGEGSASAVYALRDLGFSNACGVYRPPFFSLKRKRLVYELDYNDNSFDFVLSRGLDEVSVPALLVLEIERVLKPGGIAAILVDVRVSNSNSLIKSATPVSSLLKASDTVHVGYMNNFTLVVFKKRIENVSYFGQFRLPANCPSITNNKPFIEQMEPVVELKPMGLEKWFAYLPKFVDASSKKRLVYIDIGAGEHLKSSVTKWFLPSYPVDRQSFNVYFVDHNTSVMLSYVKQPGVTFVYHPGLAGNNSTANSNITEDLDPSVEDEGFDFLAWFKETVQYADFVVLKMNAGKVEMKFLSELFESGVICFVDELFLHCSNRLGGRGLEDKDAMGRDCTNLFKDLRSSGVFVHQWWGD